MKSSIADCINNKVLVETKDYDMEILCSKHGISFLRLNNYPIIGSNEFSNNNSPCHLLDYDEIYVNFIHQEYVTLYSTHRYVLSFIYCTKNKNGETLAITFDPEDFEVTEQPVQRMSKKELESFLYDSSNCLGKYIFEMHKGISYASSIPDNYTIDNKFIDLSSKSIIEKFNMSQNYPRLLGFDTNPDVKTIYDVKEFTLTYHGGLVANYNPYLITILDDSIKISEIKINFISKNLFEVESIDRVISKETIHNLLAKNKIKSKNSWSDSLWKLA